MENFQQLEQSYNVTSQNAGYNQGSALQIRLSTTEIIENIEKFLMGSRQVIEQDTKTNKVVARWVDDGIAKANKEGIHTILNYVSAIINSHTVQGNFPSEAKGESSMYESYIEEVHIDLVTHIVVNCYNWEIEDEDIDVITDFTMKLVIPFMTRLIDNKERESYDSTIRHVESNTLSERKQPAFRFGNSPQQP